MTDDDVVGMIMDYEQGTMGDVDVFKLFAHLVRTGLAWSLQGHYGRTARILIDQGYLSEDGDILDNLEEID